MRRPMTERMSMGDDNKNPAPKQEHKPPLPPTPPPKRIVKHDESEKKGSNKK